MSVSQLLHINVVLQMASD